MCFALGAALVKVILSGYNYHRPHYVLEFQPQATTTPLRKFLSSTMTQRYVVYI